MSEQEEDKDSDSFQGIKLFLQVSETTPNFFPLLPYYPLSASKTFLPLISTLTGFLDWGLVTRWSQILVTSLTITNPAHRKTKVRLENAQVEQGAVAGDVAAVGDAAVAKQEVERAWAWA